MKNYKNLLTTHCLRMLSVLGGQYVFPVMPGYPAEETENGYSNHCDEVNEQTCRSFFVLPDFFGF